MQKLLVAGAVFLTILGGYFVYSAQSDRQNSTERTLTPTTAQPRTTSDGTQEPVDLSPQTIADNLNIPWDIAFLPNGDMLVTERPGTLLRIGDNDTQIPIQNVQHVGEGGLLGIALHPDFETNNLLYLYLTTEAESGLINRVERYVFQDNRLLEKTTILDNIPGARFHDGGRIRFGPDGKLYITIGDATQSDLAQNPDTLHGTIVRIDPDGDNLETVSYGHRNPQGITWDTDGRLWSSEHGRSGVRSGFDELNLITEGTNYGWPEIQGDETQPGMEPPVIHSGPDTTWAPADALYHNGAVYFSGLRGQSIYKAILNGAQVSSLETYFNEEFGRIRTLKKGPDGNLYITTSNTDGRGTANENDDKIIMIPFEALE